MQRAYPSYAAQERGTVVPSLDFVASSNDWSLPMAAEVSLPKFRLLMNSGVLFSPALVAAVTAGNLVHVSLLLKAF